MCGSPQNLPRVPSCDKGTTELKGHKAAAQNWLFFVTSFSIPTFPHLLSSVPLSAFKALKGP